MAVPGIALEAHLVMDNSLLVTLVEYFLERIARGIPSVQLTARTQNWMTDQLAMLAKYTPDGKIHCPEGVAQEFKPRAGRMGSIPGVRPQDCDAVGRHVRGLLCCSCVPPDTVRFLRQLPRAPTRLVGPRGLSDNDLALVVQGLELTGANQAVYILSGDQDLLDFASWTRIQGSVTGRWPAARQLTALPGMLYLEAVHRNCQIATEIMSDLVNFALAKHFQRTDIIHSQKGNSILQTLLEVNASLVQSAGIKQAFRGGAA